MLDFIEEFKDIKELSNFKTVAKSRYFFEIKIEEDLTKLWQVFDFIKEKNIQFKFIWWGTNILFAFDLFDWIIIKNSLSWYKFEEWILETYSSEMISDLAENLENDFNVDRWHRFIWLPWTVGWAIYWNAWCFWLETENNFVEWKFFNIDTYEIVNLSRQELEFSYRNSKLKKEQKLFCISWKFDLNKFEEKYSTDVDNLYFREYKQPKWNSCWSFFKNLEWDSAWRLIEAVWLKWYKLWWAYFSELHANFLMSDWSATFKDLIDLKDLAISKVQNEFWITIEPEVQILKNK